MNLIRQNQQYLTSQFLLLILNHVLSSAVSSMQQLQYVKQYVKEYVACRMQAIPLFNRAGKTYFEQTFTRKDPFENYFHVTKI